MAGSGAAPSVDGLVTIQVGTSGTAAVSGAEDALAEVLASDRGNALLASGGNPESVDVSVVESAVGVVTVRFRDDAAAGPEGLEPTIWRAFLDVDGYLVTISARSFETAPLAVDRQRRLLDLAISSLRGANAAEPGGPTE